MIKVNYNERSWAIDLISEINAFASKNSRVVRRAGGESTISDGEKKFFPDVLLYGDSSNILMGWELKFPDTSITDKDFIENAELKANLLGLDSFLLWNVQLAVLYVRNKDHFSPIKVWNDCKGTINDRNIVEPKKSEWVKQLHIILKDLNDFFDMGTIKEKTFVESFKDSVIIDVILRNSIGVAKQLQVKAFKDSFFLAEANIWWRTNKLDYPGSGQWEMLARIVLVNWINKILFAHILTGFFNVTQKVKDIDGSISIDHAMQIFEDISSKCDFWNIFQSQLGEDCLTENAWSEITQLNVLLGDIEISSIGQELLQDLLENLIYSAKRKVAGQYATPMPLARLLVNLTMTNKEGVLHDPCCGTGTIARAAYEIKNEAGMNSQNALGTIIASDRIAFPLQMATLSLTEPQNMGEVLGIFKEDCTQLAINKVIKLHDPYSGKILKRKYQAVDFIVSNLPFVRQEDLNILNPNINQDTNKIIKGLLSRKMKLAPKSDLYAYLPFYLWGLLKENGRIGIITSNSWLGTEWGEKYRNLLNMFFHMESVVIAGQDRWFHNTDIITTITILNKRSSVDVIDKTEETKFITINLPLSDTKNLKEVDRLAEDIITITENESIIVQKYKTQTIQNFSLNWNALFSDISWMEKVEEKLRPITNFFNINRGERRGWDQMFYPENGHGIETEYIKPVLKSPRDIKNFIARADFEAFCCSRAKAELKKLGHTGALRWITRFEHEVNTKGKPLQEVLKRSNAYWYEMNTGTLADLVASINYGDRIFVAKLDKRSFVNQRLTRFTVKNSNLDIDLMHALLNTTLGMFFIEALGFGRGLGALDLSATRMRELPVLNPDLLSEKQKQNIKKQFSKLEKRQGLSVLDELKSQDRQLFDNTVFEAFGILECKEKIVNSLIFLHELRSKNL